VWVPPYLSRVIRYSSREGKKNHPKQGGGISRFGKTKRMPHNIGLMKVPIKNTKKFGKIFKTW